MLVIKEVYDELNNRLSSLYEQKDIESKLLQEFIAEGDLSENNDYIETRVKFEDIVSEISDLSTFLKNATIAPTINSKSYTRINLGCEFNLYIEMAGQHFTLKNVESPSSLFYNITKDDKGNFSFEDDANIYTYDAVKEISTLCNKPEYLYKLGGPTSILTEKNILDSESVLGKKLLDKEIPNTGEFILKDDLNSMIIKVSKP